MQGLPEMKPQNRDGIVTHDFNAVGGSLTQQFNFSNILSPKDIVNQYSQQPQSYSYL
jgi:hypothetical protein